MMHDHDHSHHFPPGDFYHAGDRGKEKQLLFILIVINLVGMAVEIVGGLLTNSLALLSDAAHMFTHLFSLIVAYLGVRMSMRHKDETMTFGYFRMEILAAFFNGITVIAIVFVIAMEAIYKLLQNEPVLIREMVGVAIFGLLINLGSAWMLYGASNKNINIRAVLLHLLSDTFSSIAILLGGWLIFLTGWYFIDVITSLIIALVIAYWGVGLLRRSGKILLQGVPEEIDVEEVVRAIQTLDSVKEVHDVHIWELTSHKYVMTGHILTDNLTLSQSESILRQINQLVKEKFSIGHTTFQFECTKHHPHG